MLGIKSAGEIYVHKQDFCLCDCKILPEARSNIGEKDARPVTFPCNVRLDEY